MVPPPEAAVPEAVILTCCSAPGVSVNVMGVAHGTDKSLVLAHKAAIDAHLASLGIAAAYTNVFCGGRSEIKPSEIAPDAYVEFCRSHGLDPLSMKE